MNKKLLFAALGVLQIAALVVLTVLLYGRTRSVDADLNASLGGGASLEDGPVGVVSPSYDLSAHQTLSRVVLHIRENYVEPERVKPYEMFLAALDYVQKTIPEVLVDDSRAPERIRVAVGEAEQVFDLGGLDQLWEVTMALRDIFRFLQGHITDPEQRREIEYAAINGMLSTLDPHSVLLKPESFDEVKLSTKGEFGGLGIVISIRDGSLTIISPIEDTPASRAGLKAKDKIVKIDEESTVNMNLEEAVGRLRGKPGSKVAIWVLRKNWTEPKRFVLTRAVIKIESVSSKLLEDGVGYLRIKSFQNNTYDDLHSHLEKLRSQNKNELRGLVLDLRNNPGGLLDQAILVSDRFIERGPLVITVGEGNKKREVKPAHQSGTEPSYPIVVLTNAGSASASEIVAGALKNHGRAIVLGQQTFGKGSVQVLYDFRDKSALKLTIAQYLTPGDVSIQSVGITPDIEVIPASVAKDAVHLFVRDESPREADLDKHLDRHSTAKTAAERPAMQIVHMLTPEERGETADGEPVPAEDEESETPPEEFRYDFETKLARDLVAKATGFERKQMLTEAGALVQARIVEENAGIAKALAAIGCDWVEGPAAGSPRAETSLKLSPGATVSAGDKLTVSATVRNVGDAPLFRVYGVTKSDNPFLNNLELVFGRVDPGQSRTWQVEIKLPKDMSARADLVSLVLEDQHHKIAGQSTSAMLTIREAPRPRFSYNYRVDDRQKGNGDGLLQVGEQVDLSIDVSNVGEGEAAEAVLTAKNNTGPALFLESGRDKLGTLAVGETKSGTIRFTVKQPIEVADLRLAVWDLAIGASLTEILKIPVAKAAKVRGESRGVRVGGADVPIYGAASSQSSVVGYARAGQTLRSDALVSDAEAPAQPSPEWRRLELADSRPGFVRATDVTVQKSAPKKTGKASTRGAAGQSPPVITLDLGELSTTGDVVHLSGSVSDERGLQDLFVFVNDKKVLYRSLRHVTAGADGYKVPVDLSLPLKLGANAVTLVVRENNELAARRSFSVFRLEGSAVADVTPEGRSGPRPQ